MPDQPRPTDSGAREGSHGGVSEALRTAVERTLERTGDPAGERLRAAGDAARTVLDDFARAGREAADDLSKRMEAGLGAADQISRRVESAASDVSRRVESSREDLNRRVGSAGGDIARRADGARELIGQRGDVALVEATALVDRVIALIGGDRVPGEESPSSDSNPQPEGETKDV